MGLFSIFLLNGHGSQAEPDLFLLLEEEWWTHKGSNLGPLPCEGNALPLSYASGILRPKPVNWRRIGPRQSPRFTKCGLSVSSCEHVETGRSPGGAQRNPGPF